MRSPRGLVRLAACTGAPEAARRGRRAVHSPVSSRPEENIDRFQRPEGDPPVGEIEAAHGTPRENPGFWRQVSPVTYAGRLTEPLLIQHGTADRTCPPAWPEATAAAFEKAGKVVELRWYRGEGHTFGP